MYSIKKFDTKSLVLTTVTSRLITHIVSTEKMRKDPRGTKHTYLMAVF